MFAHPPPDSRADGVAATFGFRVLGLRLQAGLDQDSLGLIRVRDDARYRMPVLQIPRSRAKVRPPSGGLNNPRGQRQDARLLSRGALAVFEDDHPGEEAVREHPLGERLVVVVWDRRAEDDQMRLVDRPRGLLAGLATHGEHGVG